MSAATTSERVKASQLRKLEKKLAREGKSLPRHHQAFLEKYTRDHRPGRPRSSSTSTRERAPTMFEARSSSSSSSSSSTPAPKIDKSADVVLDFGKPPPPPPPATTSPDASAAAAAAPTGTDLVVHDPNRCPVGPNCPRCKAAVGYVICATDGTKMWPQMDDDAAQGMAGLLLGGLSYAGKVFRDDHAVIKFEDDEKRHFAKVLSKFLWRYASWTGQANELLAMGFVGTMAVVKIATSETPGKDAQPQLNNGQPRASHS